MLEVNFSDFHELDMLCFIFCILLVYQLLLSMVEDPDMTEEEVGQRILTALKEVHWHRESKA